jgi:hypothetical protein
MGVINANTSMNLEIWNRWTYQMIDGEDDATKNQLSVSRGYMGVKHQFNELICGTFLFDFFSSGNEYDANGAGLKLRLANVNFKNYLAKDLDFTFGLMKTYFGGLYEWGYPTIDLSPYDRYGFLSSTDYGVGSHWMLPNKMLEVHLAAYNGEGYTQAGSDLDTKMAYLANLRLNPMPGLALGGSIYLKPSEGMYVDGMGEMVEYDMTPSTMAGFLRFNMMPWLDFCAHYVGYSSTYKGWDELNNEEMETDYACNVISFIPVIKIGALTDFDLDAVFRYDMYDDDADLDNDDPYSGAYDFIVAGINYYIVRSEQNQPLLWLQADYSMTTYKQEIPELQ